MDKEKINSYCPEKEKLGCFATTIRGIQVSECIDIDTCKASDKKR